MITLSRRPVIEHVPTDVYCLMLHAKQALEAGDTERASVTLDLALRKAEQS